MTTFLILALLFWLCVPRRRRELTSSDAARIAATFLYAQLAPEQRAQAESYIRNLAAENR
jgi:hypothetical protein